jgi:hypothetical protein
LETALQHLLNMQDKANKASIKKKLKVSPWLHVPGAPLHCWHDGKLKVKVRCCAPHLLYENVQYTCIKCGSNDCTLDGWTHGPRGRWIMDFDAPYILCSYTYLCNDPDCGKKSMCSDPRSLAFLGFDVSQAHDFVLSHRSGMSRRMLTSLQWSITQGMSFSGFSAMLQAMWRENYDSQRCTYSGQCARLLVSFDARQSAADDMFGGGLPPPATQRAYMPFPSYTSRGVDGYNGLTPSRKLLKMFFINWVRSLFLVAEILAILILNNCHFSIHRYKGIGISSRQKSHLTPIQTL